MRRNARVERAILDDGVDVRADVGEAGGEIALVGLARDRRDVAGRGSAPS